MLVPLSTHDAVCAVRRVLDAALNQQWAGIPENTPEYWRVYEAASRRWALARYFVRKASRLNKMYQSSLDR